MVKSIMFAGPHATGKSTTVETLVEGELRDYTFVKSAASDLSLTLGYNIGETTALQLGKYQDAVMNKALIEYQNSKDIKAIYDRSPLDFICYTKLALEDLDIIPASNPFFNRYEMLCLAMINRYCDVLILCETNLEEEYEVKQGRPAPSLEQSEFRKRYRDELNSLLGKLSPTVKVIRVPLDKQYEDRVWYILDELEEVGALND